MVPALTSIKKMVNAFKKVLDYRRYRFTKYAEVPYKTRIGGHVPPEAADLRPVSVIR